MMPRASSGQQRGQRVAERGVTDAGDECATLVEPEPISVPAGRRISQWLLLVVAAPSMVAVMWWPSLLMPGERSLSHGLLSLLMLGLCLALVTGCGLFQRAAAWQWAGAMGLSLLSIVAIFTLPWWS